MNQNVPAGHESADEDPDQIPSAVFFEEVVELMQRVLELEGPEGEDTRMRNAKERVGFLFFVKSARLLRTTLLFLSHQQKVEEREKFSIELDEKRKSFARC